MTKPDDGIKMNWPFVWATVIGLIGMGWAFGLLVHPPEAEVLHCATEAQVTIAGVEEGEGVIVFCHDYEE